MVWAWAPPPRIRMRIENVAPAQVVCVSAYSTRQGFRRNTDHRRPWRNRFGNTCSRAYDSIVTDDNWIVRCPVNNNSACADISPLAQMDTARDVYARGQRGIFIHDNIVADGTVQVELNMSTQDNVGGENIPGADQRTLANFDPL